MGERRVTADGRILEKQPDGTIIEVGRQPSQAPMQGAIPLGPRDNTKGNAAALNQSEFDYRRQKDEIDRADRAAKDERDRKDQADALEAKMQADGFVRGPDGRWMQKPPISAEDRAAVAADARKKLELIDSLEARSRDNYFTTGFGQPVASRIPGTSAYDVKADIGTVGSSGAINRVMELAKANGGKNPLTPLSNADMQMLGQSVSNLDPGQSDANFQKNLGSYRDIYTRALAAVEPNAPELRPAGVVEGQDNRRAVATGKSRFIPDDEVNGTIFQMYRQGKSYDEIAAYASSRGYRMDRPSVETMQYAKQHPNWNPFNPAGRTENLSTRQQLSAMPVAGYAGGASSAITMGFNDEIAGLAAAASGGDYTKARDEFQGRKQAVADMNPISNIGGNIVGGALLPMGAGAVGARVAPGAASKALAMLANNPMKAATAYGATYGAGENNQDRLTGAAEGAVGGLGGGMLGKYVIGPGLSKIASSSGGQKLAQAVEPVAAWARGKLGTQAIGPASITSGERLIGREADMGAVRQNLSDAADMNLPYSLADADPMLRMLAGKVARKSPEVRAMAEDALDPRAMGQIDRLMGGIDDHLAPRTNIEQRSQQLIAAGNQEATPYYTMARGQTAPVDAEINALLETPAGRDALKRAYEIARNEGISGNDIGLTANAAGDITQTQAPSFQTLDLTKRGLDSRINESRNPITGQVDFSGDPVLQSVEGLRKRLVSRLDELNPEYPKGRAAYAKWAQKADALKAGQSLSAPGVLPRQVENAMPRLSQNLDEVQRGYATGIGDTAEKVRYSSNPYENVMGSPAAQQKMAMIFPEGAPKMQRLYGLERDMGKTRYEVMGNSTTPARLAADQSFEGILGEQGVNAIGGLATGNPGWGTAARGALMALRMGAGKAGEKRAKELAPLLFEQNPTGLLSQFDDMAARIKADKAYQKKWQKRGGLFGAGTAIPLLTQQ